MADVKTSIEQLPESRVRVSVEVDAKTVEGRVRAAAGELSRDMKVPGFRAGKVPPEVVLQQMGRESVLDRAVRDAIPDWYEDALRAAGVTPVGSPKLEMDALPEKGNTLGFSFEVGVRPTAKIGEYRGLEVARRAADVPDEEVQAQLDRVRESLASLETVERAAADGDFVVVDFEGFVDGEPFEGGDARGYLLELGSGRLIPGFEEQVVGASPGEEREVKVSFPDEYQAEHLAGKEATFNVSVKEVKEKQLPELDDDLAVDAGGYDTLDELRDEIRNQLAEAADQDIEREYREAAVDAVAEKAEIDVPGPLAHAKAHEMWHLTTQRLAQQGISPQQYLTMTNMTEEQLITESEGEAESALKREAVLAAVIEAEGIEVSDDEVIESLRHAASHDPAVQAQGEPTEKALRKQLKKAEENGTAGALREDIAMRKAVDLIVDAATAIEPQAKAASDEIWTPDEEGEKQSSSELWTPGS